MKTLKQIKDDYAIQQGFANWYELITYCNVKYLDHYITEVMILAQKQVLQNASEKAHEMLDMLKECKLQLEYLNEKFTETGTTNSLLSKIESLIKQSTEL